MALADLDADLLAQARQGAGLEALSNEDYLLKRKLADRRGTGLVLRQAAELLFAREPTAHDVSVVLRNTTTLTETDREFLGLLAGEDLNPEELRALLQAHRNTQVHNASLRSLTGVDTLGASQILRRLRDRGLLELHKAGSQSFYTLAPKLLGGDLPERETPWLVREETVRDWGELPTDRGELGADRGELPRDRGELGADREEPLASDLQEAIASLGTRPRRERLRSVISQLCEGQWRSPSWLAQQLGVNADTLSERHLSPMVKSGLLERRYPDIPTHSKQAYRTHLIQPDLNLA